MLKTGIFATIMLVFLGGLTPNQVLARAYTIEPVHSSVSFSVSHLGTSYSIGRFNTVSGEFNFDPAAPEKSTASVMVDLASVDMNNEAWDKAVKTEFFNTAKFTTARFVSTAVKVTDTNKGQVTGDLTMLDITRPVTFAVNFNACKTSPYSKQEICGFSGTTTLKRSEWGMLYAIPDVGDDVTVRVEIEGNPKMELNK